MYDRFVLAWNAGIDVQGKFDDTLGQAFALYAELPRDLGSLGGMYTRQPMWKHGLHANTDHEFYTYCGLDAAVTLEIHRKLKTELARAGISSRHYDFTLRLQDPLLWMQLRGVSYDLQRAKVLLVEEEAKLWPLQHELN